MKICFYSLLLSIACLFMSTALLSQNVGIGTTAPKARLHVADSSVVFTATGPIAATEGGPPVSNSGRRMMWYPDRAAFRVGYVNGTQWDKANVGGYSFASGYNSMANGTYSTATGLGTVASGNYATAMGVLSKAAGNNSTSMGEETTANGESSTAMGFATLANNSYATAMGQSTTASGYASTAMGQATTASGDYSTAIGNYVSTSNHEGVLVIGDHSSNGITMNSFTNNSMRARFSGGYRFYTSSDLTTNALLAAGDNAWSTSSDVRLKENFEDIDGESILNKIATFHLTSWNYKTQDPHTFRHYGPMAQDFHAAFGQDSYGTIGNDTTINQSDFLGVNFMAVQALEKRTATLNVKMQELSAMNQELAAINEKQNILIQKFTEEIEKLEALVKAKDQ